MRPPPSERLRALGLRLPPPPEPKGSYAPIVVDGRLAYVSGQIPLEGGAVLSPGLVDASVPVARAKELARRATLQGLSATSAALGSLDRIERPVRVAVFVASSEGFTRQHEVGNGATELLNELFGDEAKPARVSLGASRLPLDAPVEVELLLALR